MDDCADKFAAVRRSLVASVRTVLFFCRGERLVRHVLDSAKWKVSYPRSRGLSHLRSRAYAMKGPTRGPTAGSLANSDGTAGLSQTERPARPGAAFHNLGATGI